ALGEFRRAAARHPEEIGADEDLPVAGGAGADPDRRYDEGGGDAGGDVGRNRLEDDAERAGLLEDPRVLEDLLGGVLAAPLDLEAAERVDALRREANVADDRN